MHWIDWSIVFALIIALICTLVKAQKYVKCPADFLAANRCAGRYLLCITSGIAAIGAISIICNFEIYYKACFSSVWWGFLSAPIGLVIAIVGWVSYRMRETRCLTMAQFFEVRYSRSFRIFAGILGWVSGVLNYGIFPAVSVKFFIYYCQLPPVFRIPGIPFEFSTFVCLLLFAIGMGVSFAIFGGQIAVMLTDFIQGMFCNIAFLILMICLVMRFKWDMIFDTFIAYSNTHPRQSLFNPYDTTSISGFNIWYFLAGILMAFLAAGTWQGSVGYAAASKSPHEGKMGSFLGSWRGLVQTALLIFIPVCAIVFFNHPQFASEAQVVEGELQGLSAHLSVREAASVVSQARIPMFLTHMLPVGCVGIFAAVMFAAMLSTDDTYMHSWGSIFIQDVFMPIYGKPLTEKQHIRLLQCSIIFVGVFAFFFSWLFKQTEYIMLYFAVTGAIFTGGAGAVLIGGLYSKTGTSKGAWTAMIVGSALALGSIYVQQKWEVVAVNLSGALEGGWLEALFDKFHWTHVPLSRWFLDNKNSYPINNQILSISLTIFGYLLYFGVSWIDRRINKLPVFEIDRMLHRGQYDTHHEHQEAWNPGKVWRLLGLTKEFTFFDRCIFFACMSWNLGWFLVFIVGTIGQLSFGWEPVSWLRLWKFYVMLAFFLGTITTVWFFIGGILDVKELFRVLSSDERNLADNGTVVDGKNAE